MQRADIARHEEAGTRVPNALEGVSDDALEQRLYGPKVTGRAARPLPDPAWIHTELRRASVTLELLHLEYLQQQPGGYRYSAFCVHYRDWLARQRLSMRQVHKAGEKLFVDYSGKKPEIVEAATGAVRPVELFVAVLGASNYTYAEATATQRSADFIQSHGRVVEYLGGVPAAIVPDQLKPGVRDACRYEPILQRTYEEWAAHYATAILPARPAKPRDKAKVEVAVQVAQRWILARLRHETFFALDRLNTRIRELLVDLNARPMKGYGGASRRDLFTRFDQPALRPLPAERFVYTEWRQARVNIDYHVDVERHLYSVPHRLTHQIVDLRLSATTLEVFLRGTRIHAIAEAYLTQQRDPASASLSFDERLGMLVDAEQLARENRALTRRLKEARLRLSHACLEDLDCSGRKLDRALVRQLATCRWASTRTS